MTTIGGAAPVGPRDVVDRHRAGRAQLRRRVDARHARDQRRAGAEPVVARVVRGRRRDAGRVDGHARRRERDAAVDPEAVARERLQAQRGVELVAVLAVWQVERLGIGALALGHHRDGSARHGLADGPLRGAVAVAAHDHAAGHAGRGPGDPQPHAAACHLGLGEARDEPQLLGAVDDEDAVAGRGHLELRARRRGRGGQRHEHGCERGPHQPAQLSAPIFLAASSTAALIGVSFCTSSTPFFWSFALAASARSPSRPVASPVALVSSCVVGLDVLDGLERPRARPAACPPAPRPS